MVAMAVEQLVKGEPAAAVVFATVELAVLDGPDVAIVEDSAVLLAMPRR